MFGAIGERFQSLMAMIASCLPADPKAHGKRRSSKWKAVRNAFLRTHGECAACGTTSPLEVHHAHPFHLFPHLELVEDNLIALCESKSHNCHLIFGHLLNWSSWNEYVREDTARFRGAVRTRPGRKAS